MDKRTLLAFALSILVIIGFQLFLAPKKTDLTNVDNKEIVQSEKKAVVSGDVTADNIKSDNIKQPAESVKNTVEIVQPLKSFDVTNGLITVTFNENTGDIRQVALLKYEDKEFHKVFKSDYDMDYLTVTPETGGVFKATRSNSNNKTTITFTSAGEGFGVTKIYEIFKDSYKIDLSVKITNNSGVTLKTPVSLSIGAGLGEGFAEARYLFTGPQLYDGKKVREEKVDDVEEPEIYANPKWIGYTSKYMLFAAATPNMDTGRFEKYKASAVIKGDTPVTINPNSQSTTQITIYAGPKQYDLLKSLDLKLEKSIEFGIFSFLAIPMLKVLNFIYGAVQNYGVAIIILTIVIKALTFPLTQKSMVSMKKMQKLQPQINKLKEKCGADKQKLNKEMMELYKKEGASPFGGCLPIFLQIPIFFALYKTLLVSIELTGSPFFGWITDLSLKDPYYITPIIMGGTMFLQQKMTPQAGDPMQQKIFLMMPVVFTFLFLSFPSGLVVYWLTNNVLTIAQQYVINKKLA